MLDTFFKRLGGIALGNPKLLAAQATTSPTVQAAIDSMAHPAGGPQPAPPACATLPTRPLCTTGSKPLRYRSAAATDVAATLRRARKAQAASASQQAGRLSVDDCVGIGCLLLMLLLAAVSLDGLLDLSDSTTLSAGLVLAWVRPAPKQPARPCPADCSQHHAQCPTPLACGLGEAPTHHVTWVSHPAEAAALLAALVLAGHITLTLIGISLHAGLSA
ncbi:hypothetical protein JI742_09965 [Piscinibacter sp. Jin2]|uniref:Uncharacterized protein n=1 Tax=Aquariibacter lacus TaxID=2801332 RepID=A0A9X0XIS3_9BURK|nr:hypothetical protein [Piscinibacter lacus]MBL0720215.1 hypothetical protein [Piscinibacter lacus]